MCPYLLRILICFLIYSCFSGIKPIDGFTVSYDKIIKEYKKEIEQKSKDLQQIEKQLKNKKEEKEKYKKEEEKVSKEINLIDQELGRISSGITETQSQVQITQKKLKHTEQEIQTTKIEIINGQKILKAQLTSIYIDHYALQYLFTDPWLEKLKVLALKIRAKGITLANTKKGYVENLHDKYLDTQKKLSDLKNKLSIAQKEQKLVHEDKSKLYKTTQERRISAEKEIKRLNETAKELGNFIADLEQKKIKTIEEKRQEELAKKKFKEERKELPWPVQGEIITKFGRNKHAELDTYIISNGIKIQTQLSESVLSVNSGKVVYAKDFRSYGKTVIIDHSGGIYTIYGQLNEILVAEGIEVKSGDAIGKTGTGDKGVLYFEICIDGQSQDPLLWLK